MNRLRYLATVLPGILLFACAPPPAPDAPDATEQVRGPSIRFTELGDGLERVRLAFRQKDDAWHATFPTHDASVDATGLVIRPAFARDDERLAGAPLSIHLAEIGRDGATAPFLALRPGEHGTVERPGLLATERIENTPKGVEQSWLFKTRPEGRGDVVVRQKVEGLVFTHSDEKGLHFAGQEDSPGVVYGHATWIDASGAKTALPSLFEDGFIVQRVPASLVDSSAYPAVLDPLVSNDVALARVVWGMQDMKPAVAANSSQFYLAWQGVASGQTYAIGAGIDIDGEVISSEAFVFSDEASGQDSPAIASNGDAFLGVWKAANGQVHGTLVDGSSDRNIGKKDFMKLGNTGEILQKPAVASVGDSSFVVWHRVDTGNHRVYGQLVGASSVSYAPMLISGATSGAKTDAAVASNGERYLVVWQDYRNSMNDVYGALLDETGTVIKGEFLISSGEHESLKPSVASAGGGFLVVWEEQGTKKAAKGRFVDAEGEVDATPVSFATSTHDQSFPVVASGGAVYAVVWQQATSQTTRFDVSFLRVGPDGEFLDPEPVVLKSEAKMIRHLSAAGSAGRYLVAWETNAKKLAAVHADINSAPVAEDMAFETDEDTPLDLTLEATDADGDPLTFSIVEPPENGTLEGDGPDFLYVPDEDWYGEDTFTFVASDGRAESEVRTVTVTVHPVNDAPVADDLDIELDEDTTVAIELTGRDVEDDPLTFSIQTPPANGTLSGPPPTLTYTPNADFFGTDSFTYVANDGELDSAPATVTIVVHPVNDAPVAIGDELTMKQGETLEFTLRASDVDGDELSLRITKEPASGTLTHDEGATYVYVPNAGFRGRDEIAFVANDGELDSNEALVVITVENLPPVVSIEADTVAPGAFAPVTFTTHASDPGGDALTFAWDFGDGRTSNEQSPVHVYATSGTYTASVTASDGLLDAVASLEIVVSPARPRIEPATRVVEGDEGETLEFTATVSHPNADETPTLSWDFGDGSPLVIGNDVSHRYADDGVYTIVITATDSANESTTATWEARIRNLPPVPKAQDTLTVEEGSRAQATLEATDPAGDADPLVWQLVEGPGELTPNGVYSWLTAVGDAGTHSVRARVSDDDGGVAELVFDVVVTAASSPPGDTPNDPPPADTTKPTEPGGCGGCASGGSAPGLLWLGALVFARLRKKNQG